MSQSYGQYCPLALATELLGQRWTMLVVGALLDGCDQFNQLQRALPRISPTLLSKRLSELERAGVVERQEQPAKAHATYRLTEAGEELLPIIMQLAKWGHRWGREMTTEDLDPAFLLWSMHLRIDQSKLPPGQVVMEFEFTGVPDEIDRMWLISRNREIEMCLKDPGEETDLFIHSEIRTFVEAWRGFRDLRNEISAGRIKLAGPTALKQAFPNWLLLSMIADEQRRQPGAEQGLQCQTGSMVR